MSLDFKYEGGFMGTKRHGHGKLTFHDHTVLEGRWCEGYLNGTATFTDSNGVESIVIYNNGRPV